MIKIYFVSIISILFLGCEEPKTKTIEDKLLNLNLQNETKDNGQKEIDQILKNQRDK